jgi:tetratricopeptide (TPR) repeat protein
LRVVAWMDLTPDQRVMGMVSGFGSERIVSFLLKVVICLGLAVSFQGCFQNPEAFYLKAVKFIEQAKYERAERLLFKVLEIRPNHHDAQYSLGVVYLNQERYPEAITCFKKVLDLNPDDVDSIINLGVIYARQNRLDLAAKEYEKAARKAPGNHSVLLNLARLLTKKKRFREARLLYERILRSQPNLFAANKELGTVYKEEGKLSEAIRQFSRAAKLQRQDPEVMYELGLLYYKKGNFNTASKYYLRALALKEELRFYLALGTLYETTRQKQDAITSFQKAYQLDKSSYEATYHLGRLFLGLGEVDRAQEYLKAAMALKPRAPELHKTIGVVLLRQQNFDLAREYFLKSRLLNPQMREIYYYLGLIELRGGNEKEAEVLFTKEVKESASNKRAWFELASLLLHKKQRERGLKVLKQALDHHPKAAALFELLGAAHLEIAEEEKQDSGLYVALESYDQAIKALTKSLKLENSRFTVLEKLLMAYRGARRYGVAVPYFEQMLRLRPKDIQYHTDLARGYVDHQEYEKAADVLNQYLNKTPKDAAAWFQLGKIHADKGDFIEGIEIFSKSIALDPKDPKKRLFLGMLLAEVNRFSEALVTLRLAVEQSSPDSVVRKRCEDLIQQILEVSGIKEEVAAKQLGSKLEKKIKRKKKSGRRKVKLGSQAYVKVMVYSGLKLLKKLERKGWTPRRKRHILQYIKIRLIQNYRKLIKYRKFPNRFTRRYYYLGIRKLIEKVRNL